MRIEKEGFEPFLRDLIVAGNLVIGVSLERVILADSIVLGHTVRFLVDGAVPPCDPVGWDATAPCRRLGFTARYSGVLVVTISWSGGAALDATIVTASGIYLGISRESGSERVTADALVEAGQHYEIRVSSYYETKAFDLRADLTP